MYSDWTDSVEKVWMKQTGAATSGTKEELRFIMTTSIKQFTLMVLLLCVHLAAGLECMACENHECSSQKPVKCYWGETFCYTKVNEASYRYLNVSHTDTRLIKGCDSSRMCSSSGGHYISHHTGIESYLSNYTCCDTDNCNADNASLSPPAGSMQCYGCDPRTLECTANLSCNGLETCFKAFLDTNGPHAMHGCVSESLCTNSSLAQQYLGPVTSFSCCNTSHCNAPEEEHKCMACTDDTCSSQRSVLCSTPMCYTSAYSDSYHPGIMKSCARPSSLCTAPGSHFVSYQLGDEHFALNITCCNDNNCNTVDPDIAPPAGSLQCYSCDRHSDKCTPHVTCNALEVCSHTMSEHSRIYGCVSENLCNNLNLSQDVFHLRTALSCCNTTNCNVPHNATVLPIALTTATMTLTMDPCTDEDDDCSIFSSAGRVLPLTVLALALMLSTDIIANIREN